ncbi:MAG: carbohydrate ABC transporter permease [Geminicoccaceae bacterium]
MPILLPYFWMFTISVSAKTGGVSSVVLWRACAVLVPTVLAIGFLNALVERGAARLYGRRHPRRGGAVLAWSVGNELHLQNWKFLHNSNFVQELVGRRASTVNRSSRRSGPPSATRSPWRWCRRCWSSSVGTLAGYYLSRFNFHGRASFLQALLVLHAFPALTLIIPIFLLMYWVGLLDTLTGVILVITTLELPFAVFIMKGFFDAVPWDIEMSALVDGASRRQAFFRVVLPQVKVGLLAVGVFAFIRGWEEYVFVRTLLFAKQNWTMSLYIFWVSDDIMGVDYGVVAAVGVFYIVPSILLYVFCQKYLVQMSLGGIKG